MSDEFVPQSLAFRAASKDSLQIQQKENEINKWELDPSEIRMGKKIGQGAFGTVYRGLWRGKEVAIKKLNVQKFDDKTLEAFRKEVEIMSKLRHPNVVLFMGACFIPGHYMIVTELMRKGSVRDLLVNANTTLSFKAKMKMAKDAALGMNWLHCSKPTFIHRDLKTSNLLVDGHGTVKVADFGLSHVKHHSTSKTHGFIGTPLWMAPEVVANLEYDESCDLYSFGIMLWEILTGKTPFPHIRKWKDMVTTVVTKKKRPEIPHKCPARLRKLIEACWSHDPRDRPKFGQIIGQFDKIIVDAIVLDTAGRHMWRKYFLKDKVREEVSWRNFVIAICWFYKERLPQNPDDVRWKCLERLVCSPNKRVTIEQFSKTLEWFGPMTSLNQLLDNIEELLKKSYFHGLISSADAERLLRDKPAGTFLVRFSRDPGCYAISSVSKSGRLKHFRIYHKPGLDYLIGDPPSECASIPNIVTRYHRDLYLKSACSGSPFADIFNA